MENHTEVNRLGSSAPYAGVLRTGFAGLFGVRYYAVGRIELHSHDIILLEFHMNVFLMFLLDRIGVDLPRLVQHVNTVARIR